MSRSASSVGERSKLPMMECVASISVWKSGSEASESKGMRMLGEEGDDMYFLVEMAESSHDSSKKDSSPGSADCVVVAEEVPIGELSAQTLEHRRDSATAPKGIPRR